MLSVACIIYHGNEFAAVVLNELFGREEAFHARKDVSDDGVLPSVWTQLKAAGYRGTLQEFIVVVIFWTERRPEASDAVARRHMHEVSIQHQAASFVCSASLQLGCIGSSEVFCSSVTAAAGVAAGLGGPPAEPVGRGVFPASHLLPHATAFQQRESCIF